MGIFYILANELLPSPKLSFQHLIGYDRRLLIQDLLMAFLNRFLPHSSLIPRPGLFHDYGEVVSGAASSELDLLELLLLELWRQVRCPPEIIYQLV